MSMMARIVAVASVVMMLGGVGPSGTSALAQQGDVIVDLAEVPLPVQELPEEGYQVLTGGYVDLETAAARIAEPRQRSQTTLFAELSNAGWLQGYAVDLVLLEDRGYPDSDILALVQTHVSLFADEDGAARAYELMSDYSNQRQPESIEAPVADSTTVRLATESGDTLRTVVLRDRMVVEVVSLEGFGFVQEESHDWTVSATVERLEVLQASHESVGLMPRAARLTDGELLADLQDLDQSGVHQLYRIREGVTQPAAGELNPPPPDAIAAGVSDLYHASEAISLNGGTAFMSTWIARFSSDEAADAMAAEIELGVPSAYLVDPYFTIAQGEQATSQGVAGVYRITGIHEGQPYSGTLEVRLHGDYLVAIGFRTIGSSLPPVDVTSRVMDYQMGCLDQIAACPPLDLAVLLTPPMATPVVPSTSTGMVVSEEFGWTLELDENRWTITEEFSESGYDFVELQAGQSLVTLESVINQHGDPEQCIVDELRMLQELESSALIELGSDIEGELSAGSGAGHGWAIYRVEPLADERADQEYVIRLDCYTLIEGGANLVIAHRAPRDAWAEERGLGDEVRGGLFLPSMMGQGLPMVVLRQEERGWLQAA